MARTHIAIRWLASGFGAGLLVAVLASGAAASTGGTSAGGGGGTVGTPAPTGITTTLGTITFAPTTVVDGQKTTATGMLSSADAGEPVSLELESTAGVWYVVATKLVAANGSFSISWRASVVGQYTARVVTGALASSIVSVSTPEAPLVVVKSVLATWYGPGLYGNHTACGEKLTKHILGLADRSLPCGTPVTVFYEGRSITVPVIDRGPFSNGATFDLTWATAEALAITETVDVGYTAQKGKKMVATNWYAPGSTGPSGTTGASGASGPSGASGATNSGGAQAPS
jgi:rare lipoprotein A